MTTEKDFRKYTKKTLEQLDTILPKGSFVIHTGLADGRVLWDMMHDRLHPLGEYGKDITFQVISRVFSQRDRLIDHAPLRRK